MVGWVDVADSDWGDFRRRRAVDISSFIYHMKDHLPNNAPLGVSGFIQWSEIQPAQRNLITNKFIIEFKSRCRQQRLLLSSLSVLL